MANGIGAGTYIGIGEETTEGTAVTPTLFLPVRSGDWKRDIAKEVLEPLGLPGDAIPASRGTFVTADNAGGSFAITGYYNSVLLLTLLKHAFGNVTTAGAGPYTYTYDMTRTQPTKPSLTIEGVIGRGGPSSNAEQYAGSRISKIDFTVSNAAPVVVNVEFMAQATAGRVSPTSPTFAGSLQPATHNHATDFTFNSVQSTDITSLKLSIDLKHERAPQLGSLTSGAMIQAGLVEVTIEVTQRFYSNANYAAYIAKTEAAGALTITNGTQSMAFSFGALEVMSNSTPPGGAGVIEQTTTYKAHGTTSIPGGVGLVITNAVAP